MDQKISSSPQSAHLPSWRTELLITLLGLLGLFLFLAFYDRAFPSAAIDLELSRAKTIAQAQEILEAQGYDLEDYKLALTFGGDTWASYYLQHVLGVSETNQLIQDAQVPIWYWRARWFRPLQKEEFQLQLAPDGQVIDFSHSILEDAPGASIAQEAAQTLAQTYLHQERGWDLAEWEQISASSEDRPGGRTDHTFEWQRRDWDVGESELRMTVTVQGDRVDGYSYWLKVPEAFQREFVQQRQKAGFINNLSLLLSFGLLGFLFALALWRADLRLPSIQAVSALPALAAGGVALANGLNRLPLAKAAYSTTQDYALFWVELAIATVAWTFSVGMFLFMLWYLARWFAKQVWPRQDRVLARRGNTWRRLARSGWRGIMLALMEAGYLVIFYLLATEFLGSWTPMGPNYSSAYALPLPFLGALEDGLLPALWEELMFRLLGISAILWFCRTFTRLSERTCQLLALVVPGLMWGFAHLSYVRDPFYLRGIELTLAAIFLEGLFFLKFDLATAIVGHFAYNAGLTALPLLRSGEPYFVVSGLLVMAFIAAPVIPGAVLALRNWLRGETWDEVQPTMRPCQVVDCEALQALDVKGADWATWLAMPTVTAFCLQTADDIIGVAAAQRMDAGRARILTVYIAPAWRRQYWGSELVDALCAYLRVASLSPSVPPSTGRRESLPSSLQLDLGTPLGWAVQLISSPQALAQGVKEIEVVIDVDESVAKSFWISLGWTSTKVIFSQPIEQAPPTFEWRVLLDKVLKALKRLPARIFRR